MVKKIEKFYSVQSLPIKVILFVVALIVIYALANLVLPPIMRWDKSLVQHYTTSCFKKMK
ncbi:conserved domain protein [Streptococcus sp. oral taxon 056 str. F0418]|uniref:hypothetical protein n=1 Tax=Streptococcus sp. oral taxon 056 TaxID=712620 RepID=UPI00021812A9|nr:hypothetical protein [Streptococcus sp. oral taxon 056]EGP67377.1 conserved domain protein [Streptococcus sp. oral taxon 056 str. F0418]